MHKRVHAPTPFEVLIGTYPHETEQDMSPPLQPLPVRTTVLHGPVHTDGNAKVQSGLMALDPATGIIAPEMGSFRVTDNNFGTGRTVLVLGNYRLISNVEFIPGGGAAATAVAIAAVINRLHGYSATVLGDRVDVEYDTGPADQIDFKAEYYGTHTNFTFANDIGLLAVGSPRIEAPQLA